MKDKFKVNFFIVLPGAIVTMILLGFLTRGNVAELSGDYPFDLVKILPYLGVLVAALSGAHVLVVLVGGTIFAGIIGLMDGSYQLSSFLQAVAEGVQSMEDLAIVSILIGGIVGIIQHNGGIDYLLRVITSKIKTKKGAEFGIAGLVSVADIATANNTIAIIITGPVAKRIADEYGVDPRKSASLLDTFSTSWQGILPYGVQLLSAAGLAAISPVSIMLYSFYPILMGISCVIAILIGYPKFKGRIDSSQ